MKQSRRPPRKKDAVPFGRTTPSAFVIAASVVGILIFGAGLRLSAARGEMWLDEIWSLHFAGQASRWQDLFTAIHHDNNHHLNTLYLMWVPETTNWVVYRAHSILAGVATIWLGGLVARRMGDWTARVYAMLFIAGSFLLTLYGSEARGYALAVMFSFAAMLSAARFLETSRLPWLITFWISALLGILSHLGFVHALFGILLWTTYRALQAHGARGAISLAVLHSPPVLILVMLYWIDLRHVIVGGGPMRTPSDVITGALSLTVGGPESGPLAAGAAAVALAALLGSIVLLWRSASDLWVLVMAITIVAPLLTLAAIPTELLYERYFLVPAAFAVACYGFLTAAAARRSTWWGAALIMAFLIPNLAHTQRLIALGRGSYQQALAYVSEHAVQHPVTIGGDHDFRQSRLVEFYRLTVPEARDVEYHTPPEWAMAGPEWMLVHGFERNFVPVALLSLPGGRQYQLAAVYPYAGLSGWHLAVYHNVLALPR